MSQNVPQCPISNDHHDIPSPADPPLTPAAPPQESLASSRLVSTGAPAPTPSNKPQSEIGNPQSAIDNPQLPALQLTAIDLLVLGHKDTAVADAIGIDRRTLYRWRHHDPRFRDELDRRRKDLLDHTADRFRTLLADALDTFARHLKDPYAPTAHRAARALLALAAIGNPRHPSPPPPPLSKPLTTDNGQMTTPP